MLINSLIYRLEENIKHNVYNSFNIWIDNCLVYKDVNYINEKIKLFNNQEILNNNQNIFLINNDEIAISNNKRLNNIINFIKNNEDYIDQLRLFIRINDLIRSYNYCELKLYHFLIDGIINYEDFDLLDYEYIKKIFNPYERVCFDCFSGKILYKDNNYIDNNFNPIIK